MQQITFKASPKDECSKSGFCKLFTHRDTHIHLHTHTHTHTHIYTPEHSLNLGNLRQLEIAFLTFLNTPLIRLIPIQLKQLKIQLKQCIISTMQTKWREIVYPI